MNSKPKVKVWMSGKISVDGHPFVKARARFSYQPDDPYAVHVAITTRHSHPVEWVFARDLLMLGTTEPAGAGDVVVAPAPEPRSADLLVALGVSGPCAVLTVSIPDVRSFLWRTYDLVPSGREDQHLDVDGLVIQLLAA